VIGDSDSRVMFIVQLVNWTKCRMMSADVYMGRLHLSSTYGGTCRAVLVDRPSFLLLYVARTDLGMPMDTILVTIQGSER